MSLKSTSFGLVAALSFAMPAFAEGITIEDPYARAAGATAIAGAAFMIIQNDSDTDDRLVSATSDVSRRVELHTHIADGDVMRMVEVEDGFVIPAGGEHALKRGGDHVMFMGINTPFVQNETITVTLTFEHAGEIEVEIPIDLERNDAMMMGDGEGMQHGNQGDSDN